MFGGLCQFCLVSTVLQLAVLGAAQDSVDFPSFFSFSQSSSPFSISFPTPDLTPGRSFWGKSNKVFNKPVTKVPEKTESELSNVIVDLDLDKPKRQIKPVKSFNNFIHNNNNQFLSLHDIPANSLRGVKRPVRQRPFRPSRQNRFSAPRYPPFDPFNTTYIPLPGPSSPRFALPLNGDNPHMNRGSRFVKFARPIRQIQPSSNTPTIIYRGNQSPTGRILPAVTPYGQSRISQPQKEWFTYKSSPSFNKINVGELLQKHDVIHVK